MTGGTTVRLAAMLDVCLRAALPVLGMALAGLPLRANDLFVAPGGTPFGPGTLSSPYDLSTALSGSVSRPGDTFWLRGGDYKLGHLDTSIQGAPGEPITFRPVSGENAQIDGSISVFSSPGYVVFRDFELYSSDTNRASSQTNAGFNPTDISIIPGIGCYAPNLSLINLVVHDQTRHGIYTANDSTNILVYGCIIYNNGWISPDNAEGHGIYVQASVGTRTVADNIIFNNAGVGLHIYDNAPGRLLTGVTAEGNVAFNAGAIQNVRPYRDWIVGVDSPADHADNIVFKKNMGYRLPTLATQTEAQIGRDHTNGTLVLTDNYLPLGLLMNNWSNATVSKNLLAPRLQNSYVVALDQTLIPLNAYWDRNTYVCLQGGEEMSLNLLPYNFSEWQATTGFDWNSLFILGDLGGARVFVRTNLYEQGRACIIVYNWDQVGNIAVNVSSVLALGAGFEVRNAEDFHAPPVLSGVFDGSPLLLPMTNLTVAVPNGPMLTPPPTGPTFNVFVLLPHPGALQIRQVGGSVQVSWPVSFGANALQSNNNLANSAGWTYSTGITTLVGDQFMITEPMGPVAKFYRLRVRQ